jgi:23S rRNA (uridine2552-2'-O)-methyltransferase
MGRRAPPGRRFPAVAVRRAGRRKHSSTQWLSRQLNDPYVAEARRLGYRSRAALKLIGLDDRFCLLRPGQRVLDLGCAPGGWTQVAVERVCGDGRGLVVGVDLVQTGLLPGATLLCGDIRDPGTRAALESVLGGPAEIVLSDMSPATTGHAATDHLRIIALAEDAFDLASQLLERGGAFVAKVFQGGAEGALLAALKCDFAQLRHAKPPASRPESAETYIVATGFRGGG